MDGTRLAYANSGEGPPIVRAAHWMSHLQHDWRSPVWRHWIRELSRHNRLVRYDERCNGMSDWDVEDVSFEAMVSDLEAVVDANRLERFTLLGISQSCAVSVAYAIKHPERVAGLILYGGYVQGWRKRGDPGEIATREALATLMRRAGDRTTRSFASSSHRASFPAGKPRTELPASTNSSASRSRRRMRGDCKTCSAISTFRTAEAGKCSDAHPAWPADRIAPFESGRQFRDGNPRARLVELDTANHILVENEPAFGQFLHEVRPSRPPRLTFARRRTCISRRRWTCQKAGDS